MERQKLTLSHRELIEPALKAMRCELSEYSFANLYLYRQVHEIEALLGDELYISGKTYDAKRFLMPTSLQGLEKLARQDKLLEGIDCLFPIAEEWLTLFDPARFKAYYKDDDSDYLFETLHMATLKGRHLSKKRNQVKQFHELYSVVKKKLDSSNKGDALQLLKMWNELHQFTDTPCQEAIELLDALHLEGEIYYIENEPAGFMIGEAITDETYCLHFSKANIKFKGIYQYLCQDSALGLLDRVTFLNMEQDLGQPDLRQAKHSYQPLKMCRKFRVLLYT